jgi:HAD superfamily hydrolase (TIGR01509 family)
VASVSDLPPGNAVIFDFDGLLMDTESTMFESWRFEWSQWGLELNPSGFFADHGGDVSAERYDALAAAVGARYDRAMSHRRRVDFRDGLHQRLDVGQGMRGWIREAKEEGIRLAIASSSPRHWLDSHLGRVGLLDQFDVIAAGDEVRNHKPHPDIYQLALRRLGIAPDRCVAVEDTRHGVRAAQSAGLACIAIPNPFVAPEAVAEADLVLTSAESTPLAEAWERCRQGKVKRLTRSQARGSTWVVSVKGVVFDGDGVLLALNERKEWELPGGQLEAGETPEHCVRREILEESNLLVEPCGLLDAWVFDVVPGKLVLILAYACTLVSSPSSLLVSAEHSEVRFVPLQDMAGLLLPDGYRAAIERARRAQMCGPK